MNIIFIYSNLVFESRFLFCDEAIVHSYVVQRPVPGAIAGDLVADDELRLALPGAKIALYILTVLLQDAVFVD